MIAALLVVALLQQPTAPPPPPKPTMQSPIAKAVVQPAEAAVTVGDTLRLSVSAFDSAGRPYTDYSSNWFTSGGFSKEEWTRPDSSPADPPELSMSRPWSVPRAGASRSPRSRESRSCLLRAARVDLDPVPTKLYVGQSVLITATPFAANDDRRSDEVAWTSDRAGVVTVSPEGPSWRRRPARRTSPLQRRATKTIPITVAANPVTSVSLDPAKTSVRAGDVVPIKFSAKAGKSVP